MPQRLYTVHLRSGAALEVRASTFEVTEKGIIFFDEEERPLRDTYINPSEVIAVVPPSSPTTRSGFPNPR